ncbi:NtaA/DmoA family FMN-dependent monooxygenase [Rhodococcus sp. (in: high G+C Gram-positive bacteria)]|uniref:NtaA/DmoA family FMN-dependent monooxygenase n=1 Tax=Rhodococcus sp. TaxID=1831 RepID=UPI00257BD1B0|nr:NtaA/DmoA family FMN-dependent monooxygenase [Rhodococcus sp. (in: high G+C Gram-positive bacteria)]MBQ7804441.1 NtaA/DmoA family FMN-dependent monooxygenase [Rhodococcus sp. (in: high G+C Gram-positive bacteria)]
MTNTKFHLGYFTKFGKPAWALDTRKSIGSKWFDGSYHVDLAKKLEAAKLDFILFEDTTVVADKFGESMEMDLKHAVTAPKHDPLPLLPLMAYETSNIGLISTASTTFYEPFVLARLFSTLDSLTGGRVGWNIVTSSEINAAKNIGLDALPPHAERYAIADEYVELAVKLWESWEEGSLVADEESGVYIDHTKVHTVDHVGKYFKSRGPLNTLRSPQARPFLSQAGASDRGRSFAAKNAEMVIGLTAGGLDEMKELRKDIRGRAESFGRNPDDIKIIYLANGLEFPGSEPKVDEATKARMEQAAFEYLITMGASTMDVDFSKYDLDGPMDQTMTGGGHTSALDFVKQAGAQGATLRQVFSGGMRAEGGLDLTGTPEEIAEKMADAMNEVGGDGFLLEGGDLAGSIDVVTGELVPALQRLGAVRSEYRGITLRDNMREF